MQSTKLIGEVIGHGKIVACSNCGYPLRDDHGYVINGKYLCKLQYKCNMRKAELNRQQNIANGKQVKFVIPN